MDPKSVKSVTLEALPVDPPQETLIRLNQIQILSTPIHYKNVRTGTYEVKLLSLGQFPVSILEVRNDIVLDGEVLKDLLVNRLLLFRQSRRLRRGSFMVLLVREERLVVHRWRASCTISRRGRRDG